LSSLILIITFDKPFGVRTNLVVMEQVSALEASVALRQAIPLEVAPVRAVLDPVEVGTVVKVLCLTLRYDTLYKFRILGNVASVVKRLTLVLIGAFGQSTGGSSLFGQPKPAFGAPSSSGSSLFGGTTATAGSGGFGSGSSTFGGSTANPSPFGGSSTSGGFSFGQPKSTSFGSGGGTGLFGGVGSTTGTSGFGTGQTNPFGQSGAGTALGQNVPPSEGTGITPFHPTNEKDGTSNTTNSFQSINFMPAYSKYSFEVRSPISSHITR
jgi:hypothetical protein